MGTQRHPMAAWLARPFQRQSRRVATQAACVFWPFAGLPGGRDRGHHAQGTAAGGARVSGHHVRPDGFPGAMPPITCGHPASRVWASDTCSSEHRAGWSWLVWFKGSWGTAGPSSLGVVLKTCYRWAASRSCTETRVSRLWAQAPYSPNWALGSPL